MSTGYYGIPGKIARGKTHFVSNGKPICGYRPTRQHIYLFCAAGFSSNYVECERCKIVARAAAEGEKK